MIQENVTPLEELISSLQMHVVGTETNAEVDKQKEKEKSYLFTGGETEIKLVISGLRIISCIPTHDPKENPATQLCGAAGCCACSQSKAVAASVSSPIPLSN